MPNFINAPQVTGGQQLFLSYLRQRFGESIVMRLFEAANEGDAALDRAIAETDMRDPVTGAAPTSGEIFSDFAAANIINRLFGDGRFAYTNALLDPGEVAAASELELEHSLKTAGVPYGVAYYFYTAPEAQTIQVQFQGAESISRFAGRSSDLENRFYLADSLPNADLTLTRRVDLTGVSAAELTFDALFDLSTGWNYGYVSVSVDEGETWEALPVVGGEVNNLHGAAYGPGFTGVSSPEAPRSFPIMGVVLGADGVTIGDLSPDGPAQRAGMQIGDVLIGVDGETWQTTPNILEVLSGYAPGQMVVFRVQRGARSHEIPVMFGAHPTRTVMPESEWMPQVVDLTLYAGQEILLRFEMVTLPAYERVTFAVDNLAIEAIGWRDDGDLPDDWALNGWSATAERVPAEWMLTAVYTGDQDDRPPRVERMLMGEGFNSNFRVGLGANETLILAVSALNTNTDQPAAFELELTGAD
ncbi:MAG: immune inhibitor A [Anaerolineae bacterium]|nr:immune inhibitor A [Anaerolineae bacterium]